MPGSPKSNQIDSRKIIVQPSKPLNWGSSRSSSRVYHVSRMKKFSSKKIQQKKSPTSPADQKFPHNTPPAFESMLHGSYWKCSDFPAIVMFARFFRGYNPSYPLKKDKKRSFIGVQIKGLVLQGAVYNRVPGCVCVCVYRLHPNKKVHQGKDNILDQTLSPHVSGSLKGERNEVVKVKSPKKSPFFPTKEQVLNRERNKMICWWCDWCDMNFEMPEFLQVVVRFLDFLCKNWGGQLIKCASLTSFCLSFDKWTLAEKCTTERA